MTVGTSPVSTWRGDQDDALALVRVLARAGYGFECAATSISGRAREEAHVVLDGET